MANLDTVKVGDLVVVSWRQRKYIATVQRVTDTQFVASGMRFTKNGRRLGDSNAWPNTRARLATPELIAEIKLEQSYANALHRLLRNIEEVAAARRELENSADRFLRIADLEKAAALASQAVSVLRQQESEEANG